MSHEPSEEELRAAFEEQLRQITVQDVLVQTVVTLINLAGRRLGLTAEPEERDLEQARLAIEGTRALVPLVPEEAAAQLRQPLSQLQMAYAREAQGGGERGAEGGEPREQAAPGAKPPPGGETPAPGTAGKAPGAEEAERAKARSKIWTPPGT